jgi:hypothetical protein
MSAAKPLHFRFSSDVLTLTRAKGDHGLIPPPGGDSGSVRSSRSTPIPALTFEKLLAGPLSIARERYQMILHR